MKKIHYSVCLSCEKFRKELEEKLKQDALKLYIKNIVGKYLKVFDLNFYQK